MSASKIDTSREKKVRTLLIIFLVLIAVFAASFLTISALWTDLFGGSDEIGYAQSYSNVTIVQAYELLNKSDNGEINLTIVDCRGLEGCSTCQYNRGHLPGAERSDNPLSYENETNDILVYSVDGSVGAQFCENLTQNLVYGEIYNLIGGWDAWLDHNETYGWPPIKVGSTP